MSYQDIVAMMASLDPTDPCSSVKTREQLDRWTHQIELLLSDPNTIEGHDRPEARERFKMFLETRRLNRASKVLEYWEQVNEWNKTNDAYTSTPSVDEKAITNLMSEARTIIQFASENLNFTCAQIELLENALQANDPASVRAALETSLTDAKELLKPQYEAFRKTLRENNSHLLYN
uniref:Uncharacterized protein n=1 Tax=Cacopsylla melanoneura TaxID=428564 RepID=A0A8D8QSD0_9HEMI